MTKQVALSDPAYAALAARKRPGESFSGVVLRLTGGQDKDPDAFLRHRGKRIMSPAEHRAMVAADRDASTEPA